MWQNGLKLKVRKVLGLIRTFLEALFVVDVIDRIYDVITFISRYLYFKKGWGSHFS